MTYKKIDSKKFKEYSKITDNFERLSEELLNLNKALKDFETKKRDQATPQLFFIGGIFVGFLLNLLANIVDNIITSSLDLQYRVYIVIVTLATSLGIIIIIYFVIKLYLSPLLEIKRIKKELNNTKNEFSLVMSEFRRSIEKSQKTRL